MTALPSNLALVGEDLARATSGTRGVGAGGAGPSRCRRVAFASVTHGERGHRERLALRRDTDACAPFPRSAAAT